MQRVYGVIDDETFHRMNKAVDETKSSRAQWIGEAIIEKLQHIDSGPSLDAMKLNDEVMKLRDENTHLNDELVHHKQLLTTHSDERNDELVMKNDELVKLNDEKGRQLLHLNDELAMKGDELDKLKNELINATQLWQDFRNQKKDLEKNLAATQATIQGLQTELIEKQTEASQAAKVREDLAVARTDRERLQDALKVRNEDVAFYQALIHQLNEKLPRAEALPPSQEEAKKKGWWQFWK
jgi:chromosome segregation ATPase